MRVLQINDESKKRVQEVLAWAKPREHWYTVRDGRGVGPAPGDHPEQKFRAQLDTYRCVFSYTVEEKKGERKLFRQLSISVPSTAYPHPVAAFTIAQMFGFTGWDGVTTERMPQGWYGMVKDGEHCIVLAQEIQETQI